MATGISTFFAGGITAASAGIAIGGGGAIAAVTNAAFNLWARLYPSIPIAGAVGKRVTDILDPTGSSSMQNAALSRTESFAANQIENFITTEEGALFQVDKIKEGILKGGDNLKDIMDKPIQVVEVAKKTYILDGHNRLKAFSELGQKVQVTVLSIEDATIKFKDKVADIIKNNFNTSLKDEH